MIPWRRLRGISLLLFTVFLMGCLIQYYNKASQNISISTKSREQVIYNDLDPLQPDTVPNIVYYIWCDRKIFEFKHYLSVKSVFKYIKPDRVVFYFAHRPRTDKYQYNRWYVDLSEEEPSFQTMSADTHKVMCDTLEGRQKLIKHVLKQGGIYVYENVIFTQFPLEVRTANMVTTLQKGKDGFVVAKQKFVDQIQIEKPASSKSEHSVALFCPLPGTYDTLMNQSDYTCITYSKGKSLVPRDLWNNTGASRELGNLLMYEQKKVPVPNPSSELLIPNIAHILWIGGSQMDFLFYLCCLSLLHVVKVDNLFIHGDVEPAGSYWQQIKKSKNVRFVPLPVLPDLVYGHVTKNRAHMSDIYRVEIMLKYGGIYSDADVIWVKPIPDNLRTYDAVACLDWPQMYDTFPDYINFGTSLGKKGATFWKMFRETMKRFKDDVYGHNGLLVPYKLYERHPDLVYLYNRLQVMCWDLKCHPTWVPGFRSPNVSHLKTKPPLQWNDSIAFHWTYPTPQELTSLDNVMVGDSLFADIGKHILRSAGIVK